MTALFTNVASTFLAAPLGVSDTQTTLSPGEGAKFPDTSVAGTYFRCAIEDVDANIEYVTATRAGDVLTLTRAQEGTPARAFSTGSVLEIRSTAATLNGYLQLEGGIMQGGIDMANNKIDNAVIADSTLRSNGAAPNEPTSIVSNPSIQWATGSTTNRITFENVAGFGNGDPVPTIAGAAILTTANSDQGSTGILPIGAIVLWSGDKNSIPTGWSICDGSNGTPDLKERFVMGAVKFEDSDYYWGKTGGDTEFTTEAGGAHNHAGSTGGHSLTEAELAPHVHPPAGGQGDFLTESGGGGVIGSSSPVPIGTANATGSAGGGQAHSHTIASSANHTHTLQNVLPQFYALYYIMRTS